MRRNKKLLKVNLTFFWIACLVFSRLLFAQNYFVKGKVFTSAGIVKYASVTFINNSDTTKKYFTTTDASGNYSLNIITGVIDEKPNIPNSLELEQNYPNPFSSETVISYRINKQSKINIKIYDILGREVKVFSVSAQLNGINSILWDGTNNFGRKVSPGVYFYKLQTNDGVLAKKMIFTGGKGINNIPIISGLSSIRNAGEYTKQIIKKLRATRTETIKYKVVVKNTANTQPGISIREFYQVAIEQDTILDFIVKEAANYDMNLYVGNWGYDQVFVIDTNSDTIVDTLTGFISVSDIVATRSGKKLYVTSSQYSVYPYDTTYPATVYSVDMQKKIKKQILEKSASIYLEPDGVPLILAWQGNDSLKQVGMIDTVSDEITFFDNLDIINAGYEGLVFDPQKTIYYSWTNKYNFFSYNYKEKEITQYYNFVNTPSRMVISPDGKQIYFANGPVLDVILDSIVGSVPSNNLGSLALRQDGQYLYVTDPGKYILPEPVPGGKIKVLLTSTDTYIDSIDVNKASGQTHTITDRMIIMPDGKKAYVTDSISNIFVLDLEIDEVVNVIRFVPRNIQIRPLYLGKK